VLLSSRKSRSPGTGCYMHPSPQPT
jgi:hypothetical protein